MNTAKIPILIAAVVLTGATLAGILVSFQGTSEAATVQVRQEGVIVATSAREDKAIAELSDRVGFEVRLPSSLPDGIELKFVDSALGPAGAENALKLAFLSYGPKDASDGDYVVGVEQAGVRFSAPDDRAQEIELGLAGVEAYFQATDRAVGYWVFTAERGFLVTVRGAGAPGDSEMRKMIASLVQE